MDRGKYSFERDITIDFNPLFKYLENLDILVTKAIVEVTLSSKSVISDEELLELTPHLKNAKLAMYYTLHELSYFNPEIVFMAKEWLADDKLKIKLIKVVAT